MASADVETGRVPDVISDRRRSTTQKEHRARRYSRKTSDESEASPRVSISHAEQRRRNRPEGIRSLIHRRQQAALRRSSESALLPPIHAPTIRQGATSPTHDANETSSPTSNVTFSGANVPEAESPKGLSTGSTVLVPLLEHQSISPHTRNDGQTAETPDTCLSPHANSDHVRFRAERRMLKSVNDTMNELTSPKSPKSPTAPVAENSIPTPRQNIVRSKPTRRASMQSLPKISTMEEPFSIRRKIEQFRKWHEEQYTEKLKKLKVDAEKEKRERESDSKPQTQTQPVEIDFTKILEDNMKDPQPDPPSQKDANGNVVSSEKTSTKVTLRKSSRCKSGATWRTWRDANDSYAYTDVTKYIKENELLPPDRVQWINDWIGEVEKALNGPRDEHWDEQNNVTIDLRSFP